MGNKTKETYLAAVYGVTADQILELRNAINMTWQQIAWDVHIGDHATEDQQMIELCVDADRLKYNGDIGDWFDDVDEQMLLAFDAYDVYPDEFWKSHAEKNDIKMWMLR